MKLTKKLTVLVLAFLMVFAISGCRGLKVVKEIASVDGNIISEGEFKYYLENIKTQNIIETYGDDKIRYQLEFNDNPILKENNTYKYSITSFKDLFYISRKFVLKGNSRIGKCKKCNRYFLTQNRSDEKYCHRINKDGKVCKKYNVQNEPEIWKKTYKQIYNMLSKRDERNSIIYPDKKFNELQEFIQKFQLIERKFGNDDIKIQEWLEGEHKRLKSKK